jgi:hypothetical protein
MATGATFGHTSDFGQLHVHEQPCEAPLPTGPRPPAMPCISVPLRARMVSLFRRSFLELFSSMLRILWLREAA